MISASQSGLLPSSASRSYSQQGSDSSPSSSAPSAISSALPDRESAPAEIVVVARLLHQLERLQDQAYAATGKLMAALVEARIEQNMSPTVGKSVRAALSRAALDLSSSQAHTADTHRLLETIVKRLDIDPAMFGDGSKDPQAGSGRPLFTGG